MKKFLICLSVFLMAFTPVHLFADENNPQKENLIELILSDKTEDEICSVIQSIKYKKSEINVKDENGYSPLYLAIDTGKVEVLKVLLKEGAKKNEITNLTMRDKSGKTVLRCSPVLYAAWKGRTECLSYLLEKGSKANIESDIIIPAGENSTYLRLLNPIDAAFYNRNKIDFNEVHKILSASVDYQHIHFSGPKWAYTRIKTNDLLNEYNLLEIK